MWLGNWTTVLSTYFSLPTTRHSHMELCRVLETRVSPRTRQPCMICSARHATAEHEHGQRSMSGLQAMRSRSTWLCCCCYCFCFNKVNIRHRLCLKWGRRGGGSLVPGVIRSSNGHWGCYSVLFDLVFSGLPICVSVQKPCVGNGFVH